MTAHFWGLVAIYGASITRTHNNAFFCPYCGTNVMSSDFHPSLDDLVQSQVSPDCSLEQVKRVLES